MNYRYGYMKRGDSPRLTKKSAALRALERQQAKYSGVIEVWFTAEDLKDLAPKEPCGAVYSELAHAYHVCDCGFMVYQHKNIVRHDYNIIRRVDACTPKVSTSSSKNRITLH